MLSLRAQLALQLVAASLPQKEIDISKAVKLADKLHEVIGNTPDTGKIPLPDLLAQLVTVATSP